MSKKNLGKNITNIKRGNDSWGNDIVSNIHDISNTLLPNGYFTGEHTILADRNPTIEDIGAVLNGSSITFELGKWRWINTVTKEIFLFKGVESTTVNVPNGGLDTDWINPQTGALTGLAAGWYDYGNNNSGYDFAIVTGNGFTGNAQRVVLTNTNFTANITSSNITIEAGKTYTLYFKYRSNHSLKIATLKDGTFTGANTTLASTGETLQDGSFTFTATGSNYQIYFGVATTNAPGDYIEVDEVYVKSNSTAHWEKLNDLNNSTTSAPNGSVFVVNEGGLKAVESTSGFIYIDGSRTDDYTPNGSMFLPYKSLKDCISAGHNNCTVILNEGTYDSGESLAIPDSMNLIGMAYDNTVIAANVTFTNYSGDGQGVRYLRFSGNVTQVTGSWVVYERCYFVGTGSNINLGGRKCSLRDCNFESTLGTITLASDQIHLYNTAIKKAITVSSSRATFSDCDIDGTVTHPSGAGMLILHNTLLNASIGLISSVTNNQLTPIILSGILHVGELQFNNAHTIIHGALPMSGGASVSGTNVSVNVLTAGNTIPYTPSEDYHPATRKFVLDNAGGGDADAFLSTVDKYFSHYPIGSRITYKHNDSNMFLLVNASNVTPTTTGSDIDTLTTALTNEGWNILAKPWRNTDTFNAGELVYYNNDIYEAGSAITAGNFSDQDWTKSNDLIHGHEYYKTISSYAQGSKVKFYYNILENQTAGSITPAVVSSSLEDMISEGWTLLKGANITASKHLLVNAAGDWASSIKDSVAINNSQTHTDSYLNCLPTLVIDRDPLSTDITAVVGPEAESISIEYGWKWYNKINNNTWECRRRYFDTTWKTEWVKLEHCDTLSIDVGNSTSGLLILGDINDNQLIKVDFVITRNNSIEHGSLRLSKKDDNKIGLLSYGDDTGIMFTKVINGDNIELHYSDDVPIGIASHIDIEFKRK